jgi:hypothetical protein
VQSDHTSRTTPAQLPHPQAHLALGGVARREVVLAHVHVALRLRRVHAAILGWYGFGISLLEGEGGCLPSLIGDMRKGGRGNGAEEEGQMAEEWETGTNPHARAHRWKTDQHSAEVFRGAGSRVHHHTNHMQIARTHARKYSCTQDNLEPAYEELEAVHVGVVVESGRL